MGYGRWDSDAWSSYSTASVSGKSASDIFTSRTLKENFDPSKFVLRESRDSDINPASTPIIIACDVTGSMGKTAHTMIGTGLNATATELYDRKPVSDPHILIMAIGDCETDRAPIQATQFEGDISVAEQTTQLFVEGGGGANSGESYCGAHAFAAFKTAHDSFEKRGRKGYLFTIGDEPPLDGMSASQLKRFLDIDAEKNYTARELYEMASQTYEVFHILLVNEGYCRHGAASTKAKWDALMPQHVIPLEDASMLAEAIVSTIQVNEGAAAAAVASSWGDGKALVVANAIGGLVATSGATQAVMRV